MVFRVVGISGSLRKESYNTSLLRAAIELKPEGMEIEIFDIGSIPLYNMDVEEKLGFPQSVRDLKKKLKEADGILIATPEHNNSIPGVLKNTIDWISRDENEFSNKPTAIMGGSDGMFGTISAQHHLRSILVKVNAVIMPQPFMQVPKIDQKVDPDGRLVDEKTREKLRKFLIAFERWIERVG